MMGRQREYYKDQEVRVSDVDELFVGAQGGLLFVYLCLLGVFSLENGNTEGGNRFLNFDCFFVTRTLFLLFSLLHHFHLPQLGQLDNSHIFLRRSDDLLSHKNSYLFLACDSPAKAFITFLVSFTKIAVLFEAYSSDLELIIPFIEVSFTKV